MKLVNDYTRPIKIVKIFFQSNDICCLLDESHRSTQNHNDKSTKCCKNTERKYVNKIYSWKAHEDGINTRLISNPNKRTILIKTVFINYHIILNFNIVNCLLEYKKKYNKRTNIKYVPKINLRFLKTEDDYNANERYKTICNFSKRNLPNGKISK